MIFTIKNVNLLFLAHTMDPPFPQKVLAEPLKLFSELFEPLGVILLGRFCHRLFPRHIFCNRTNGDFHYSEHFQNRLKTIIKNRNGNEISEFNGFEAIVEVLWSKVPQQAIVTFVIIWVFPPLHLSNKSFLLKSV